MKNEMEKIDDLIKQALSKEEAKFYDDLEEQNLLGKIGEVYRSKLGWLVMIMNAVLVLVFGLLIFCVISFFDANETNQLIKWAGGAFFCMIIMVMSKLFVWMQMDKNDILRELKRLELQVSVLTNK